ncbi:alpha-amylase family protein [Bifidobacterium leontopitheci]|uniref:Alpha-amylase n=1 Tax=Bifidobacterium leontopitheci TaxID=2650774 RepID=A0A6I1GN34_9BIFI|nr:alpha-amylase family protein [Bifidobacterium leontopitheci]KAB7790966.1 alpha-amylase [Bifidobacterium leontopitheci]
MNVNDSTIWWQVYPLGFTGAPIRPTTAEHRRMTPRLDRIIPWLDYLIGLGANGLLLGPIFDSSTHGYDTTDYYRIDPRLGDDAAFDRLVDACRSRGIRIMLDGVFNHVGRDFGPFRDALAGHGHDAMFLITRNADGGVDYAKFEGHAELPELNHDDPEVSAMVTDVMKHWLRRGASAWRLDAAYAVDPAFWTRVLPAVREEFPDAWFMGEVIHGDYADTITRSGMDSLTQYELWKAMWSAIESGNFYELEWSLRRHNAFLKTFTPFTFAGNHDVTRIASRIGDAGAALAMTVLFTVGGIPCVYYGDEQAFRGVKEDRLGGDDAVRPAFPPSPDDLPRAGEWMYHLIQGLISLRRRNPWLTHARTRPVHLENRHFVYESVGTMPDELIRVELTLDPEPHATIWQRDVPVMHVHR